MSWIHVDSVEELKSFGKFNEVKAMIKQDVGVNIKITGRGWKELFTSIQNFKALVESLELVSVKEVADDSHYFASVGTEYIYYLVELDGELRTQKLGISKAQFTNKKKAKEWRDQIVKQIHPDVNHHPNATQAMNILNEIYATMVGK